MQLISKNLLKKYNGSILHILSEIFPKLNWKDWDDKGTRSVISKGQHILFAILSKLAPLWRIFMNYKHPGI